MAKTDNLVLEKIMDIHSLLGQNSAMIKELKESNIIRKTELLEIKEDIKKIYNKLNSGEGKIRKNQEMAQTALSLANDNKKWRVNNGKKILSIYGGVIFILSAVVNFIFSRINWDQIVNFFTNVLK